MSDTPRTDAAEERDSYAFQILYPGQKYRGVKGDRMRGLERELTAARAEIERLRGKVREAWEEGIYAVTDDNNTEANRRTAWNDSRAKRVMEGKE